MSTRFKGKLDERKIKLLAEIGCTQAEIAAVLEVSDDVISKHYSKVVEQGKQHCRASLRRMLWVSARNGNVTAQIWLSKQYCGFRDNPPDDGRDRPPAGGQQGPGVHRRTEAAQWCDAGRADLEVAAGIGC